MCTCRKSVRVYTFSQFKDVECTVLTVVYNKGMIDNNHEHLVRKLARSYYGQHSPTLIQQVQTAESSMASLKKICSLLHLFEYVKLTEQATIEFVCFSKGIVKSSHKH